MCEIYSIFNFIANHEGSKFRVYVVSTYINKLKYKYLPTTACLA